MANKIDPKALVSKSAQLGNNITVGPYAIIGDNVKIDDGTVLDPFAQVIGNTQVGKNCRIFSYAVIGNISQDLKYTGQKSFLKIGDNNCIREFVTINLGTQENSVTTIGNNNFLMAYCHVAHDCTIGNENVLANCSTLAGHVTIGNKVTIGGLVAIHQFCRVGDHSIIGGCSKVVQDIPPYSLCDGHPAVVRGLNMIGLRRAAFPAKAIRNLKEAFKILFFEEHTFDFAEKKVKKELSQGKDIDTLLEFISSSQRGIAR